MSRVNSGSPLRVTNHKAAGSLLCKAYTGTLLLMLMLAMLSFPGELPASEKRITVALPQLPPFAMASSESGITGLLVAVIQGAFLREGVAVEFRLLPWRRAVVMAREGVVDATLTSVILGWRERYFLFSRQLESLQASLFVSCNYTGSRLNRLEDLAQIRVSGVRGDSLTDSLGGQGIPVTLTPDTRVALQMVARNRIDGHFGYEQALHHVRNSLPPEFRFKKFKIARYPLYLMVTKNRRDAEILITQFDRGYRKISDDGTLDLLRQQWLVDTITGADETYSGDCSDTESR